VSGILEVTEKVDASLIGGFIVQLDGKQIDTSVLSQFNNLKQRLTK
jgi:F0F1-type ATP synthase delta subunit